MIGPKYDAIIPALNEESTISHIINCMLRSRTVGMVHVMIDDRTTDQTEAAAIMAGAVTHSPGITGKGQLIRAGMEVTGAEYLVLSDADYVKFTPWIVSMVAPVSPLEHTMRLVVPKHPSYGDWKRSGFPKPFDPNAWAWNTGLRSLPRGLIEGTALHGYLAETQLNKKAREEGYKIEGLYCPALHAPLRFSKARMEAMEADRKWGLENGVFS